MSAVDGEHQHDDGDERQHGVRHVHHRRANHHPHGVEIVGRARHEVAGPVAMVVRGLELLQAREEVVAQVELDVARGANHDAALQEAEDATERREAKQGGRVES